MTQLEAELIATDTTPKRRRYPAYKPSGVEWLGEIPHGWKLKRLKYVAPTSTARLDHKPDALPYVGLEQIESQTGRLLMDTPVENVESTVGVFGKGDVLFGKLRPYLAKVVHVGFDGVCTTEILVLKPRQEVDGRFIFFLLLSDGFISLVNSMTFGAKMPRASSEQVGNIVAPLPPLPEQRAIAAYLDRETASIDALIARKQRLISLLQEKRTALISHAVTRSLDASAPLKPSGVEWLGEIPAHWEVKRLKQVCKKSALYGANEAATNYVEEGVRFLRTSDIDDDGKLRNNGAVYMERDLIADYLLEDGDLLLSRSGTLGRSFVYREKAHGQCAYAGYLVCFRLNARMIPEFAFYFTKSREFADWLSLSVIQATIGNVNGQKFANVAIPTPPILEQRAIAAYLDRETAKIDILIAKIRQHIAKLQEYRTAVISAAVTGKIDVRLLKEVHDHGG